MQDYEAVKSELEGIYNYIAEGIMLRSRAMWHELSEKSTKYFLTLEKRQKSKSSIKKLIISNREIVDQKDVNKIISGFIQTYSGENLYYLYNSGSIFLMLCVYPR